MSEDRKGSGAGRSLTVLPDPYDTDPEWLAYLAEAEADDQAREAYAGMVGEVAHRVLDWPTMRYELRHLGGGGISRGDYERDRIPRSVYRKRGIAPDVAAADLAHVYGWEDTDAMVADVMRTYIAWRDGLKADRDARRILRETVKTERQREAQADQDYRQFIRTFPKWFAPEVAPAGWHRFRGALVRSDEAGYIVQARRDLGADLDGGVLRWRAEADLTPPAPKRGWRGQPVAPFPELAAIQRARVRVTERIANAQPTPPSAAAPKPTTRIARLLAWLKRR
jgi:hypothetical protein